MSSKYRITWIDWMKTIGMILIVYGHFFSIGSDYIYVFSVPLFFIISGFLNKTDESNHIFWKKIVYNLIIPIIIICPANYIIEFLTMYAQGKSALMESPIALLVKMACGVLIGGLGSLWFIYTLAILKIITQFVKNRVFQIIILITFLICAYIVNNYDPVICGKNIFRIPCAVTNVFVSYPFFLIGYYLKEMKPILVEHRFCKWDIMIIIACLAVVIANVQYAETVLMCDCGYGNNMFLFILGGTAGTVIIYYVSYALKGVKWTGATTISIGTILILGLHLHLVNLTIECIPQRTLFDVVSSILIVFIFIPVIEFCEKYCPYILGKLRIPK